MPEDVTHQQQQLLVICSMRMGSNCSAALNLGVAAAAFGAAACHVVD
jgi:hypothetical protein